MELDSRSVTVAGIIYLFVLLAIWKLAIGDFAVKWRIIISVAMLPITYVATAWQLNR